MFMRRALFGALLLWVPGLVSGQAMPSQTEAEGVILRVNGPVSIAAGDSVGMLVVINGDATVAGTVRGLVVVGGTARVSGEVREEIVVARGHLDLAPGAVAGEDVMLYSSTMAANPQATVLGTIHDEPGLSFSARASWLFWLSVTLVCLAGGLLFAGLGNRQLVGAVRTMVNERRATALGAFILMAGIPALAMFAFVTVIGIPLGFAILFMLLPLVTFLGYIVTGTLLGAALIRRRNGWRTAGGKLYVEAAVGLFTLQLVAAVPGVGALIAVLASLAGAGALAVRSWRIVRPGRDAPAAPEEAAPEPRMQGA
jgi:hypothetical protein